jgi:hypothetical protein
MPPPPPDTARTIFGIIIIILYFYSSPDPGPIGVGFHSPRELYAEKLERQHHALDILNASRYGDFAPNDRGGAYLNLTGFKKEDQYAWDELDTVKRKVATIMNTKVNDGELSTDRGVYGNVTGIVKGAWVRATEMEGKPWGRSIERMNLSEIAPDVNWGWNTWNRNITGKEGELRLNIEEKAEWMKFAHDEYIQHEDEGRKGGNINKDIESDVREVAATMTVQDETSIGDGWEMRLHGVHWPRRGELIMTTTSEKFAGIFGLPHMTSSNDDFQESQKVLNRTLGAALRAKEKRFIIDFSDRWSSDQDAMPLPHCEFVVFIQIHPAQSTELHKFIKPTDQFDLVSEVLDIERELRFPTGAPVFDAPPLRMSMIAFSPDCGFIIESKGPPAYTPSEGQHLQGVKQEVFIRRIKNWSLVWGVILLAQVILIRTQMREASTPSTVSRVSLYTIGMMLLADALLFGCMMLLASSVPNVFPTATLAAFAVSLSLGMGINFIKDIYNVQAPERLERQRERIQAAEALRAARARPRTIPSPRLMPSVAPVVTAAGVDSVTPLEATPTPVRTSDIPIIVPSDQELDIEINETITRLSTLPTTVAPTRTPGLDERSRAQAEMATTYGQFMMLFMCFFFLTISSTAWPPGLRSAYVYTLGFLYLSFWIPQIYRNIMRNCRKALLWKFVLGQSILRASPFAYFFLKRDNVLFAVPSKWGMGALALWLWLQIWVLAAQEVLGPRFGLPKGWLPDAWDYHPILREDDAEGGGMPIGLVKTDASPTLERVRTGEESRKKTDGHTRSVDCAICMNSLEVPVVPSGADATSSLAAGAGGVAGMLARRLYMVTPCRHVFHSTCLESWMRFRLQCPICRENLPPL